ncbi:hypothetical protein CFC21_097685 [Triticum aestivum]|uniref:Uncharacterized protein n=2 Tax=Triticum aestivum TaxID=4565 RepID=A0A3B6RII5_WHEAT|nr:hypothetical protein CFC21_097685 [Triticum aestivum]
MTWALPANLATDMEQKPRRHMPTDGHTRKQPTALTLTTSNTGEICRICADRAEKSTREEPTTEDHAATQHPLDAIIVAKQKPTPRLSKPRGQDAAIDGEDAIILHSPSRSRLRDDAPKEEKDAKTPPSPDPTDLRFPFDAQAVGRKSNSTATLPRKIMTPAGIAVAGSGEDRSKDFSRRCADHLPPLTAAH